MPGVLGKLINKQGANAKAKAGVKERSNRYVLWMVILEPASRVFLCDFEQSTQDTKTANGSAGAVKILQGMNAEVQGTPRRPVGCAYLGGMSDGNVVGCWTVKCVNYADAATVVDTYYVKAMAMSAAGRTIRRESGGYHWVDSYCLYITLMGAVTMEKITIYIALITSMGGRGVLDLRMCTCLDDTATPELINCIKEEAAGHRITLLCPLFPEGGIQYDSAAESFNPFTSAWGDAMREAPPPPPPAPVMAVPAWLAALAAPAAAAAAPAAAAAAPAAAPDAPAPRAADEEEEDKDENDSDDL